MHKNCQRWVLSIPHKSSSFLCSSFISLSMEHPENGIYLNLKKVILNFMHIINLKNYLSFNFMTIDMLDGLNFVHCQDQHTRETDRIDEQNQISLILEQKDCLKGELVEYLKELNARIDGQNHKLMEAKNVALKEQKEMHEKFARKEIRSIQLDHPDQKFNTITLVLRAQNMSIGRHFLAKFLNKDSENKKHIEKIVRQLEMEGKVLDIVRYENKLELFDSVLETIRIQLVEKFEYMRSRCVDKKFDTLNFLYTYEEYANSLAFIKNQLESVQIEWTDIKTFDQFWTVEKRPIPVQTLYVVRHAQRQDNVKDLCQDLKRAMIRSQDVELSEHGKGQVEELAKWFKSIPIDTIYSSPFQRTIATASGILDGRNDGVYLNIEPGLTEFFKPCEQRMKFMESTELYKIYKWSNPHYWPVYNKRALEAGKDGRVSVKDPIELEKSCNFVVETTLRHILETNKNAKHIVLVSHSGTIGVIHALLTGEWAAVGQTTISKFVQYDDAAQQTVDVLKRFRMEYSSGMSHLTDHSYLRPH